MPATPLLFNASYFFLDWDPNCRSSDGLWFIGLCWPSRLQVVIWLDYWPQKSIVLVTKIELLVVDVVQFQASRQEALHGIVHHLRICGMLN